MSLVPTWPFAVGTLVVGLAVGAWSTHAWDERKYDALVAKQNAALAQANADNLKKQDALQLAADESEMKRAVDNDQHAKDLESVRASARAGTVRLSIPGTCSSTASAQAGVAAGPSQEERTDVLPGTADDLIRIAGDSARVVFDYNALLDRYNAVCR